MGNPTQEKPDAAGEPDGPLAIVVGFLKSLTSDHERFKDVAAGIQSFVLMLAAIVGGIWAAYQFHALHRGDIASADLIAKRLAVEREPVIMVDVKSDLEYMPDLKRRVVLATVTIKNVGSDTAILEMQNSDRDAPVMGIYKYEIDKTYGEYFGIVYSAPAVSHPLETDTIRPHSEQVLRYLFDVQETGVYMIVFHAYGLERLDEEKTSSTTIADSSVTAAANGSSAMRAVTATPKYRRFPYRYLGMSIVDVPSLSNKTRASSSRGNLRIPQKA